MTDTTALRRAAIEGDDQALAVYLDAFGAAGHDHREVAREWATMLLLRVYNERELLDAIDTMYRVFRAEGRKDDMDIRLLQAIDNLRRAVPKPKGQYNYVSDVRLYWVPKAGSVIDLHMDITDTGAVSVHVNTYGGPVDDPPKSEASCSVALEDDDPVDARPGHPNSNAVGLEYRRTLLGPGWDWIHTDDARWMMAHDPERLEQGGFGVLNFDEPTTWIYKKKWPIPGPLKMPRWS